MSTAPSCGPDPFTHSIELSRITLLGGGSLRGGRILQGCNSKGATRTRSCRGVNGVTCVVCPQAARAPIIRLQKQLLPNRLSFHSSQLSLTVEQASFGAAPVVFIQGRGRHPSSPHINVSQTGSYGRARMSRHSDIPWADRRGKKEKFKSRDDDNLCAPPI
jgi:hypothetical protein